MSMFGNYYPKVGIIDWEIIPKSLFVLIETIAQVVPGDAKSTGSFRNISICLFDGQLYEPENFFFICKSTFREFKIFIKPIDRLGFRFCSGNELVGGWQAQGCP